MWDILPFKKWIFGNFGGSYGSWIFLAWLLGLVWICTEVSCAAGIRCNMQQMELRVALYVFLTNDLSWSVKQLKLEYWICGCSRLCHCLRANLFLTPSTTAVPNCCCSNGSAPYWSNPPFLIFDVRALWTETPDMIWFTYGSSVLLRFCAPWRVSSLNWVTWKRWRLQPCAFGWLGSGSLFFIGRGCSPGGLEGGIHPVGSRSKAR